MGYPEARACALFWSQKATHPGAGIKLHADPLLGLWEGAENDLCLSQAGLVGAERVKDSMVGIQAAGSSNGGGGIRGLGQRSRKLELLLSKQCTWLVDATGGSQGGGGGVDAIPLQHFF